MSEMYLNELIDYCINDFMRLSQVCKAYMERSGYRYSCLIFRILLLGGGAEKCGEESKVSDSNKCR
jgi:hypothetical protein